ncbi:hypothetical protein ACWEWF_03160, partial [Streptomyces sp. NPDC003857]
ASGSSVPRCRTWKEAASTRLLLAAFQGGTLLAQVARNIGPLKDALQTAIDYVQTFATSPDAGVTAPEVGSGVHEAGRRLDGEDASGGQGRLLAR